MKNAASSSIGTAIGSPLRPMPADVSGNDGRGVGVGLPPSSGNWSSAHAPVDESARNFSSRECRSMSSTLVPTDLSRFDQSGSVGCGEVSNNPLLACTVGPSTTLPGPRWQVPDSKESLLPACSRSLGRSRPTAECIVMSGCIETQDGVGPPRVCCAASVTTRRAEAKLSSRLRRKILVLDYMLQTERRVPSKRWGPFI